MCQSNTEFKQTKMANLLRRWTTIRKKKHSDGEQSLVIFLLTLISLIYETISVFALVGKANIFPSVYNASIYFFKVFQHFVCCHGLMNHISCIVIY